MAEVRRTAFVELLPFSFSELLQANKLSSEADTMLYSGCYPPIHDREVPPRAWLTAYVTAYIERDVRQITQVQDLETFQRFVRLCAGRTGQLLNLSSLATECGITHNTAKAWISILEASYLVFLLRPHHANFNKRLVKTPKLYFYDTGLVSWLLGIQTPEQLATHPLRGNIFETLVVAELVKTFFNQAEKAPLTFWRDSTGNEVDIIIDQGGKLRPLEIKSGRTLARDSFAGLKKWITLAGDKAGQPILVYGGNENYQQKEIQVCSWRDVDMLLHGN